MDISKLQGAQSFSVQKLEKPPTAEELKALENNGKVDLIIQEGDETFILSGEKIDLNEYDQRMGEAIPNWDMGPYFNEDLRPLQNMDANKDNILTEDETRWGVSDALGKALGRMGETIEGGAVVGAYKGMGLGYKMGSTTVAKAAGLIGYALGGISGAIASPLTGGAKVAETYGELKTINTWILGNEALRDVR